MPQIKVDSQVVDVPDFLTKGADILDHPAVKEKAKGDRTVFLADPDSREVEIVDPQKEYRLRHGTQIETTAPSVSGCI
jgi:hypothetical protein